MRVRVILLSVALAACEAARPDGAYRVEEVDASAPPAENIGRKRDAEVEGDEPSDDGLGDDGPVDDPTLDAGGTVVDPMRPYAALEGVYLMRIDMYSTVKATGGTSTVSVSNRVSNLILAKFAPTSDGRLVASEQLCHQTFHHACTSGCPQTDSWKTTLDEAFFSLKTTPFANVKLEREYVLMGDRLQAKEGTVTLGFTAENPSRSTELPSDLSDPSLWQLGVGTNRVGVRAVLQAAVNSPLGPQDMVCSVVTVSRFTSSFVVPGVVASDKHALVDKVIALNTDGSKAITLAAQYNQGTDRSLQTYCSVAELDKQTALDEVQTVRFQRTSKIVCPTPEAFEADFKGDFSPPSPGSLAE